MKVSAHAKDREYRVKEGDKSVERVFEVERNGRKQLHIMLSDATVVVVDKDRNKIVTYLNCRPSQVLNYFESEGVATPIHLLQHAKLNVKNKLNY